MKEMRGAEAEIPLVMAQREERNSLAVLWKGALRGQDSKRKWSWVIAAPLSAGSQEKAPKELGQWERSAFGEL